MALSMDSLSTISPLDGRYYPEVKELANYFSEAALMRYRVQVEVLYLLALANTPGVREVRQLRPAEQERLHNLYRQFNMRAARRIKTIEAITKHDVKAVEYFIKERLKRTSLRSVVEFVHFGLTSEDVNNLAYSAMLRDALATAYWPKLKQLHSVIRQMARRYAHWSMLSLTHGQPATPTTLGKELMVVAMRLERQMRLLKSIRLLGKFSGASGNWAALQVAYPRVNWMAFAKRFVERLGFEFNPATTQIESHDRLAETYHTLMRLNTIIRNFNQDMWLYISRNLFGQYNVAEEVGSSVMPHKINPIYFENSEGNCGLANALLGHLAEKLLLSRLQRDLTDSTVLRNQGLAVAYCLLAVQNCLRGLERVAVQRDRLNEELNEHWEVLAEPIQTVMRKLGKPDPYERLKRLTRGEQLDKVTLHCFIDTLGLPETEKQALKRLTPASYIGLSAKIAQL